MIQLSALLPSGAENSRKTVGLALLGSDFQELLSSGAADGLLPDGKILPESGKTLPDGLPAAQGLQLRRLATHLAKKLAKTDNAELTRGTAELSEASEQTAGQDDILAGEPAPCNDSCGGGLPTVALPTLPAAPVLAKDQQSVAVRSEQQAAYRPAQSNPVPAILRKAISQAITARETGAETVAGAQPAGKPAIAPGIDPSISNKGQRPADAPQRERVAPGSRDEPLPQIKLQLAADTQPEANAGQASDHRAPASVSRAQADTVFPAAQFTTVETAPAQAIVRPGSEAVMPTHTAQPHGVTSQDLTALVDRLVEARDSARSSNANLTVMHADFGRVSLHFAHDNGSLTVSLANDDPGFARAVSAGVAADGSLNSDAQSQADRRAESEPRSAVRAQSGEAGLASDRGGQTRDDRRGRDEIADNPSHRETLETRPGARGIFA